MNECIAELRSWQLVEIPLTANQACLLEQQRRGLSLRDEDQSNACDSPQSLHLRTRLQVQHTIDSHPPRRGLRRPWAALPVRSMWLRRQIAHLFDDASDEWRGIERALYGA